VTDFVKKAYDSHSLRSVQPLAPFKELIPIPPELVKRPDSTIWAFPPSPAPSSTTKFLPA